MMKVSVFKQVEIRPSARDTALLQHDTTILV
jgi:hypothetical protein